MYKHLKNLDDDEYGFDDDSAAAGSRGVSAAGDPLLDFSQEPYELSASDMLADNVLLSRKMDFRAGSYLRKGWSTFTYNFTTLVVAAAGWFLTAGVVEYSLYLAFGHVNGDNAWFFQTVFDEERELMGRLVSSSGGGGPAVVEKLHSDLGVTTDQWRYVGVVSMFLTRVLIFAPMIGSAHVAVFNSMRRPSQLVHLTDMTWCFRGGRLPRYALMGSSFFFANFLLLYAVPDTLLVWAPGVSYAAYVLYYVFSFFVVPLHVEHPHASLLDSFRYSAYVVNGHKWHTAFFALLVIFLQLAGLMLAGFGALITFPFTLCSYCWAYHHLLRVNQVPWRWAPI